ncbi:hypothetical protein BaRGS_00036699 [Batillaria attramentaria]|uniref:Nicastrin n=1 Tax=Batillaria attramentaria TaxID=370345 RepID=A0ABD0JCC7_9CAEN
MLTQTTTDLSRGVGQLNVSIQNVLTDPSEVGRLTKETEDLTLTVDANRADIRNLTAVVAGLQRATPDVGNQSDNASSVTGDISSLARDMQKMMTDVGSLTSELGNVKGDVGNLAGELALLNKTLKDRASQDAGNENGQLQGTRTKKKIYIDLKAQEGCYRLLNGTHQIGCGSAQAGNVGVVHYMETDEDWDWVLKTGTTTPFAAVLHSANFTAKNVRRLVQSGRVNGIAVISVNLTAPVDGFSADKSCPNDAYGLYHDNADFENCKNETWNQAGHGLVFDDLGMPIFSLTEESDVESIINKCYLKFNKPVNGKARPYPLCAVQLESFMQAAKDTETCIRRSELVLNLNPVKFCDPLGDQNIVATLKAVPYNETRPESSVIVVGARSSTEKDVMFALFQGEAFDYIGSSRMVYEMGEGRFPVSFDMSELDTLKLQKINLTHIAQFIELSQVGRRDDSNSLWMHVDPAVLKQERTTVDAMLQQLKSHGTTAGTHLMETPEGKPLPPASVQRFLMDRKFPSIVITDHEKQFTNRFYNSHFDLAKEIDADYPSDNITDWYNATTRQSNLTASLATTLARYLFNQVTGRDPSSSEQAILTADSEEVNHLYYCYLHSPHCDLFNTTVDPKDTDALKKNTKPYPFYVSIHYKTTELTQLTQRVLAYFTGKEVINATEDTCKVMSDDTGITDERYSYLWMHGPDSGGERKPMCYKSTVLLSVAKSPAFEIDDYDWSSGKYSTWTESVWNTFRVRVFLIPSKQFQVLTLTVGIGFLLVSLVIVYFISSSADVLFQNASEPPQS